MATTAPPRRPTATTIEEQSRAPRGRRLTTALCTALVGATVGWGALDGSAPVADRGSVPTRASSLATPTTTAQSQDVTWSPFAGLSLPASRTDGPRCQATDVVTCFSHTPRGAAFAAVNLLVRTFPFAGSRVFGPTIRDQVTGRHATALMRLTWQAYRQTAAVAGIRDGSPIPYSGGWIAGYRIDRSGDASSDRARVRVLIRQDGEGGEAGFVEYTVNLIWSDGDWRLMAPPWGDWRSSARSLPSADPRDYRGFDQVGNR